MVWFGHDPDSMAVRNALRFNKHSEDIWEHRAQIISKAIADAFE